MIPRIKPTYFLAFAVAAVAALWLLSGAVKQNRPPEHPRAQTQKQDNVPLPDVRVADMTAEPVAAEAVITGRSEASKNVVLRAEIDGQVIEKPVEKGSFIKKGDILLKIAPRDRPAKLAEAQETLAFRKLRFEAAEKLENRGHDSRIQLAEAKANYMAAKAALEDARKNVAHLEIKAPFDGILGEDYAEIGDYLSPGGAVFQIVAPDPLILSAYAAEKQISLLETGQTTEIRFIDGRTTKGVLKYIAPAADPDTRTFRIEVETPNPPDNSGRFPFREGLTAELRLQAQKVEGYKISPSILALDDEGLLGVKIVDHQDTVRFVPVTILSDHPDHMWIGALPARIRLITVGQDFVADGQKVHPVSTATAGAAE